MLPGDQTDPGCKLAAIGESSRIANAGHGEPGAVWAMGGRVLAAFLFTIEDARITGMDIVMEPAHLTELHVRID